ncbi:MAG: hypothetical protein BalsKO_03200 [Balneolaceae bacterium]
MEENLKWSERAVARGIIEIVLTILYTPLVVTTFMVLLYKYIWKMDVWWPGIIEYNLFAMVFSFLITGFVNAEVVLEDWKKSLIRNEFLEKENIKAKLEALQSQVSPHFLFNNFNVINSLIDDDPKLARTYLSHLSDVYRYVLSTKSEELVPLQDELQFIERYIFLLQVRFNNKINCVIDVEKTKVYKIPPVTLQILIENTVKHNEISSRRPLGIRIVQKEDWLIVENNLQPKKNSVYKSTGVGLINLRERYQYLSDQRVVINKSSELFSVMVPLIHKSAYESINL